MSSNDNQLHQTSGASAFASVNNSTESKKQAFKNATLINLQNVDFHHKLGEGKFFKISRFICENFDMKSKTDNKDSQTTQIESKPIYFQIC